MTPFKTCKSCGKTKETSAFTRNRGECRECRANAERERYRRARAATSETLDDAPPAWLLELQERVQAATKPAAAKPRAGKRVATRRARAKTKARGYGGSHKRLRERWARVVAAGNAYCARCGGWLPPGAAWDLDHSDDRGGYIGPSHAACNRRAPNRRRAASGKRDSDPAWTGIVPPPDAGVTRWSRVW